jgi:recombination associated protein RdgC
VRSELEEFSRKYEAKNGRPPSRPQKTEQKALIRRALRSKTVPVTKVFDVSLELSTRQVLVWASSVSVVEEVQAVLEAGLETRLIQRTPQALVSPAVLESLGPTPELFGALS